MHVGVEAAPEGRLEELFAGQRPCLGADRDEHLFVAGGDLRHGGADMRPGIDHEDVDVLVEDQASGAPGRDVRRELAIGQDELERPPEDATGSVDSLHGEAEPGHAVVTEILRGAADGLEDAKLDRRPPVPSRDGGPRGGRDSGLAVLRDGGHRG